MDVLVASAGITGPNGPVREYPLDAWQRVIEVNLNDFMLSKIPLGRFGTLEEVASLVCWLASEEASFSTGTAFDVSGGRATY